ncbi:hypothetical protein EI427_09700 [Flammeovirga pectinis]|uniref:DUF304 domain-containing protein n=1 Tax=Flammeovirga pectinis TaxID=2494373 RepID=A0A3Q9FPR2_9BACT|nr:hypothetical protein [Flammeovirga pectinis]AZQ62504.1 hypothetical protein EI427_09700 [Flammeovirga pectinis]
MQKNRNSKAIVCKPKVPAFMALGVFLFILLLITVGTVRWIEVGGFEWYKLLFLVSLAFILIMMIVRLMFAYKVVSFKTKTVTQDYPLRIGAKVTIDLSQYLLFWEVRQRQVGKKLFNILTIYTKTGQPILISNRDMTYYQEAVKFMEAKFSKFHRSKVK